MSMILFVMMSTAKTNVLDTTVTIAEKALMKVWVQLVNDKPYRILRTAKDLNRAASDSIFIEMDKAQATKEIRDQVWDLADGACQKCGVLLTKRMAHMNERKHRGRQGEISIPNSEILCYQCHLGPRGSHPEKQLRFSSGVKMNHFQFTSECLDSCELQLRPVFGAKRFPRIPVCPVHGYPFESSRSSLAVKSEPEHPNNYVSETASPADVITIGETEVALY